MASCIGCFLRTGIVWKMCLPTHPCWAVSWLLWQLKLSHLLLVVWADMPISARSSDGVSELLSCLCLFICSVWIYPYLLTAGQAHKMVEKEELEIWWKEGNEKPRKQVESWVRSVCSESRSLLLCLLQSLGSWFWITGFVGHLGMGPCVSWQCWVQPVSSLPLPAFPRAPRTVSTDGSVLMAAHEMGLRDVLIYKRWGVKPGKASNIHTRAGCGRNKHWI